MSLDRELLLWINGFVGRLPVLDVLAQLFVNEYFVPVALSLGLLFLWFGGKAGRERERWQRATLTAAAAVGFANIFVALSNQAYFRDRPFEDLELRLLFYRPSDSSSPSNAVASAFALATAVWLRDRRSGWYFYTLALLLGLARLYAGVHYSSDLLGGLLFGAASAVASHVLFILCEPLVGRVVRASRKLGIA